MNNDGMTFPVIDSDQHLYETRTTWLDHIDPAFRDDALRIVDSLNIGLGIRSSFKARTKHATDVLNASPFAIFHPSAGRRDRTRRDWRASIVRTDTSIVDTDDRRARIWKRDNAKVHVRPGWGA